MSLAKRLERVGWLVILLAVAVLMLALPVFMLGLMETQRAMMAFFGTSFLFILFGFLILVISLVMGMDEGSVSSIPDEQLTPEQQLRKQELALDEQRQQQEGAMKAAQFFFGGGNNSGGLFGGSSGTKNERDTFSLTDHFRQTGNKYTGKYLRSPKCPNCGSQATAPTGNDDDVFQCDKCGNIFETRSRTRRDISLDIDE